MGEEAHLQHHVANDLSEAATSISLFPHLISVCDDGAIRASDLREEALAE